MADDSINPQLGISQMLQNPAYQKFLGQGSGGSTGGTNPDNPMLQAMLGGSLPNTNMFSAMFPNHPGLAGALGNAALMASLTPQGHTIGENISGVAGAVRQAPYAKLVQQYQMLNPGLETAQLMSKLGLESAQTEQARAMAEEHSTKNQALIMAQQLRGQAAAQINANKGKPTFGAGILPKDYVGPLGKAGETAYGNYFTEWDDNAEGGKGAPTSRFEPTHTKEEGEQLNTMGMMKPQPMWMFGVNAILQQHPEMSPSDALKQYQSQSGLALLGARDTAPPSTSNTLENQRGTQEATEKDDWEKQIAQVTPPKPGSKERDNVPDEYFGKEDAYWAQQQAKADQLSSQRNEYYKTPWQKRQGVQNFLKQGGGAANAPERPSGVPPDYVFKTNGPKGTGWYKP